MNSFRNKVSSFFQPKDWILVEYPKEPKIRGLILLILFLTMNFYFWKSIGQIVPIIPYILMIYLDVKIIQVFIKSKNQGNRELENKIRYIIHSNKLYDEENFSEVRENKRIVSKKEITRVIRIWYKETEEKIFLSIERNGDRFTTKATEITEFITSGIGLEHEETVVNIDYVDLTYMKKRPKRLHVTNSYKEQINKSLNINFGYGITYSPVDCPHILVSGGTGSGKSVFISFLIIELLKRNSNLYIADPKNSDLGSLSHYLGIERVATTPNNIARIVRLAVEEMKKRYEYMNDTKNFIYGSNFVDHGFKPVWILFDEMGAFQANATDKKSKEVVSEVMDGIKQVILLGRQSGVFCLISAQQMSANTLNTDLRDNLGLRIALGSNSQEGYRMVFGSATPETIPSIEVKGSGLLYMQGSGKESAQYWESPYVDMKKFDFIEELKKYI